MSIFGTAYLFSIVAVQILGWLVIVPDELLNDWCEHNVLSALMNFVWPIMLLPAFWRWFEEYHLKWKVRQQVREKLAAQRRAIHAERRRRLDAEVRRAVEMATGKVEP